MILPARYGATDWCAEDAADEPHPFTALELECAWSEWSGYSPVLADVMFMLARTGLRWGEARAVTVADVGGEGIIVDKSAGEGCAAHRLPGSLARIVPLVPRVRPLVRRLAVSRDADELLFTTSLGAPLRRAAVLRRLHWDETGHGRSLHDLRHTAASLWLAEGVEPSVVRDWLGTARPAA
nr:site-specific integrase [Propionicimonas sp.]